MPAAPFPNQPHADLADLTDLTAWDRDTRLLRAWAAAGGLSTPSGSSRLGTTA